MVAQILALLREDCRHLFQGLYLDIFSKVTFEIEMILGFFCHQLLQSISFDYIPAFSRVTFEIEMMIVMVFSKVTFDIEMMMIMMVTMMMIAFGNLCVIENLCVGSLVTLWSNG